MLLTIGTVAAFGVLAHAHIAPWGAGMYCKNGLSNQDNPIANEIVKPLYNLTFNDWFMHGQCKNFPPPAGEFLKLPAGGSFTVEMADSRGHTTLSFGGNNTSDWPDGKQHPEYLDGSWPAKTCITQPNLHTYNETDAAGSVFAIAYKSDIAQVNFNDLVVFTQAPHTPWKRMATFNVPANLPACPAGGCICAWGWVPNNCGEPNMYMAPWKCTVTGAKANAPKLATPKDPVWCEGKPSACVTGAKKMIAWHQLDGNNVFTDGLPPQADGRWPSPGYNAKMGFSPGAQNDIFVS